ncbi:hypothetical protein CPB83DRAFT_852442 [Crepidotus variabilis]|uniref:Uncharacterized protein n=1 Tax=Crepidotus variabilis TaxID=179855 RepID=A0A9P6JQG6_9AGAR|nr:hypothetical protein CPB83DRAFT_852442 [Crepidotus variabilis]
MKATLFSSSQEESTSGKELENDNDGDGENRSQAETQDKHALSWLDEGLPDLRTVKHHQVDLEAEFDIKLKCYLDILADSPSSSTTASPSQDIHLKNTTRSTPTVNKSKDASTVVPQASVWET